MLMEAMSSGVPVVSSELSGIPELVVNGHTGLLAHPGDVTGLAKALERYYRDPALRERLGLAGREKVLSEFNLYGNAAILAQWISQEN